MSTYCNHRIVEKPAHLTSWFLYIRTEAPAAAVAATTIEFTCEQPNARWHCRHRRSCAVHNIQNVVRAGMCTHTQEDCEKNSAHNVHYIVLSHHLCACALFTQYTHRLHDIEMETRLVCFESYVMWERLWRVFQWIHSRGSIYKYVGVGFHL